MYLKPCYPVLPLTCGMHEVLKDGCTGLETVCYIDLCYFWHDYIFSTESLILGTSTFLCFDRTKSELYWKFDSTLKKKSPAITLQLL